MKVYRGSAVSARNYLDADRSPADDYYLSEGTGIARRYTTGPDGHVIEMDPLSGDGYEAWVAGLDPVTGEPRGRLRTDDSAVRFVEVTVNGPKSWSLAAELHPVIADAYEGAQDRAAEAIIRWLGEHATSRVGPRGQQLATPVEILEAVTVRHYTSRAGDPHRHLHLQVNARVFADGAWRGLDTVAVRDMIAAVNGIGHASVVCDPEFRTALARHGFTVDEAGEIDQLAPFVPAFSQRARQIEANLDRLEAAWRADHPGEEPGPTLRRSWDTQAWELDRPDKLRTINGIHLHDHWLDQLTTSGYDRPATPAPLPGRGPDVDRDAVADLVLSRLGARRSAWNAADIRGEVEQWSAQRDWLIHPTVRQDISEDITERALSKCVPLLQRTTPEHVRALTSERVLAVEADLVGRLAVRGAIPGTEMAPALVTAAGVDAALDAGQQAALAAITGGGSLVVVEGAAGAGKTTLLAAAREQLEAQGRRMLVVTPTLKAATAVESETGTRASSAAKLAYAHGWRWDADGQWERVTHPRAVGTDAMRAGDVLVVDEAGMLDQDTARALLILADEQGARVVFIGDRYQLPAVGRGGVLDHAARWSEQVVSLDVVHRFTHTTTAPDGTARTVPDREYAALTARMRTGTDPGAVFDELVAAGRVVVHPSATERIDSLASSSGDSTANTAVVAPTREQVSALNAAIRDQRVRDGLVDDTTALTTTTGERIGVGDTVATRRNDADLGVANRDTWQVERVDERGLWVTMGDAGKQAGHESGLLPTSYVTRHVELAYATTVHGAQGSTYNTARVLLDDHSTAASAYVAMTRGRANNTAHLVADSIEAARQQWIDTFARDRADLGPASARDVAARDAARYAELRPVGVVLTELRGEWTAQADAAERLERLRDTLTAQTTWLERNTALERVTDQLRHARRHALADLDRAKEELAPSTEAVDRDTKRITHELWKQWDGEREALRRDARRVELGPGRLGHGSRAIRHAIERIEEWAQRWEPIVGEHREHPRALANFVQYPYEQKVVKAIRAHAHQQALTARPEHATLVAAATSAEQALTQASERERDHFDYRYRYGSVGQPATETDIAQTRERIETAEQKLAHAAQRLHTLTREPAVTSQPTGWLAEQRNLWKHDRDDRKASETAAANARARTRQMEYERSTNRTPNRIEPHTPSRGISR